MISRLGDLYGGKALTLVQKMMMKHVVAKFRPRIEKWLTVPKRKPLLVFGPLQSGKKSVVRLALSELGYDVIEPSNLPKDELAELRDGGMYGRTAYLMDCQVFGTKSLPNVTNAPQVFVTHVPFEIGTKAVLMKRFEMFELLTNIDCSRKSGKTAERDHQSASYWQVVDAIRRDPLDVDRVLQMVSANEFLPEIVFRTVPTKSSLSLDQLSRTADMLSIVDTFRHHLSTDVLHFLDTLGPLRECKISSKELVLKPPSLPSTTLAKSKSIVDTADQRTSAKRQKLQ